MGDLYDRLKRARERAAGSPVIPDSPRTADTDRPPPGWTWAAPLVAERSFTFGLEPRFWAAVSPGLDPAAWTDILCFDTETTGLSGGAGTVPFLIGWAELVPGANPNVAPEVRITQWFLRDLPGEPDLVAAVDRALGSARGLVSFNGASFDLPLLKSRWALACKEFPPVPHRDDLPRSRRFWKRLLESCRLAKIEESVLGIRRIDDVPGAQVPVLWFSYLRSGAPADFVLPLGGVLSHHAQDVYSLLCLDLLLAAVERRPEAPHWAATFGPFPHRPVMARVGPAGLLHPDLGPSTPVDFWGLLGLKSPESQAATLERTWADHPSEPVGLAWADLLKEGNDPNAKTVWRTLWETSRSYQALDGLVKWLEHRDRTPEALSEALAVVDEALKAPFLPREWRERLGHRRDRLLRKGPRGT